MKDLLQFMYHGEVSVKREDLTSFIGTAEVLQIKGLTNKEVSLWFHFKCFVALIKKCYLFLPNINSVRTAQKKVFPF